MKSSARSYHQCLMGVEGGGARGLERGAGPLADLAPPVIDPRVDQGKWRAVGEPTARLRGGGLALCEEPLSAQTASPRHEGRGHVS